MKQITIKLKNVHAIEGLQVRTVVPVKKNTTDPVEMVEHQSVGENILKTRANQSPLQNVADHILNAPGQNPETPEGLDQDHIKNTAIQEGLAADLVRDPKGHIQNQDILKQPHVNLQDLDVLDQDLDINALVPEVHTVETGEGLVQDVDQVLVVADHITIAGHVPLAVVGVRGRTDIEMTRIVQVVFFDCTNVHYLY